MLLAMMISKIMPRYLIFGNRTTFGCIVLALGIRFRECGVSMYPVNLISC